MKTELAAVNVYPQRNVAAVIAERLSQIKGAKHGVVQIPQGFQVVPITVCPEYVPPTKAKPIATITKTMGESLKEGEVVFSFPLVGEGLTYITVLHGAKQMAFGKTTLLGWEKDIVAGTIKLKMSASVAKKRGLLT